MKTFKQFIEEARTIEWAPHKNHPRGFYDMVHGKHTSEMTPTQKREYRARVRRDRYHEFKSKYNPWASSSAVGRDKSRT